MSSFIIYTLPRSMSTWLAHFLYERDRPVYHDKSQEWSSPNDMAKLLCNPDQDVGVVDTALILHWKKIKKYAPSIKTVAILKDAGECFAELEKLGISSTTERQNQLLHSFVEYDGPKLSLDFVKTEEGMRVLCDVLDIPFDEEKYFEFKNTQIQPLLQPMLERHKKNLDTLTTFYKEFI